MTTAHLYAHSSPTTTLCPRLTHHALLPPRTTPTSHLPPPTSHLSRLTAHGRPLTAPITHHSRHAPQPPQATALFESDPHRFIAKNVLRPRTGSNQTQDRLASGGALITGAVPLRALLRDASRRACYLLYRKARQ